MFTAFTDYTSLKQGCGQPIYSIGLAYDYFPLSVT